MFGRERELALGDAFLETATERFGVLVCHGDAGAGKTTVWGEVVRRAEDRGFRVLSCRPAETETKYALSAVADLVEAVPGEAVAALPDPQRRALEVALVRVEASGASAQPRALATAVRSLFLGLSGEEPLLVAIDDVQWLDKASADVLEFALRRLAGARAGWLFARRVGEPCRLDPDRLVPPEFLTRLAVGPLTVAALHHMLKDRLEEPLSRSALVRVHAISGGNPFYALEIAREMARSEGITGVLMPVPDSVRGLLSRRLRRLPEPTRDALLVASALSEPTTSLVDEDALRPAEEDDIVTVDSDGRVAFRHPLYASAVYASASRMRRRIVHMSLAERITDSEERARHLAAVTTDPDETIAQALASGAAVARSRGAWGSAAELLEQASKLTPSDGSDSAHAREISAAEHHIRAGDRSHARALLEGALSQPLPRPLRADALRLLGEISYNDEDLREATRLFTAALDDAEEPRTAIAIELGLAYSYSQLFDFAHGIPHAHSALERAEAAPDQPLLAEALAFTAMFDWLGGEGVDWDKVEQSLALENPDSIVPLAWRPSTLAGLLYAYVGRHAEGRERVHAAWADAVDRGDESDVAFVALWLSWLETRAGDLDRAAALVEEALALAAATEGRATGAWALAHRAYVHAVRGDVAKTREDCAEAAALLERFDHVLASIWIAAALGLLELSLGDPDAAWRACEPLVVGVEMQGIGEPIPLFFLPEALEALIALGELDRAEPLIGCLEERGRQLDREWALATGARCRALLLAARGDLEGASDAVEQALVEHARLDMPFELGRTLLVAGVLQRRKRQRARAKASLEEAQEIFERLGTRLWAVRACEEIARLGLRRGSDRDLTASERRVAELVAKGMSNREVAAALSVSPKTVEANLGRIYRKLDISSRAELGARMATTLQT